MDVPRTPEQRAQQELADIKRELVKSLVVPQLERFTAWLESRDIHPVTFLVGYGEQVDKEWTWPELMQEWYREMEAFS